MAQVKNVEYINATRNGNRELMFVHREEVLHMHLYVVVMHHCFTVSFISLDGILQPRERCFEIHNREGKAFMHM